MVGIASDSPLEICDNTNPYRMLTSVADEVEIHGDSVFVKFGLWAYIFVPKDMEEIEKAYEKYRPDCLDVHFRKEDIPKWAEDFSYSNRYSMTCDLRKVVANDDPSFVTVQANRTEYFKICAELSSKNFELGPSYLDSLESMFRAAFHRGATILIAYEGTTPAGCGIVEYSVDIAVVYFFSVNSQFRRKGVGTRLIRRLVALAKDRGAKEAVLLAEGETGKGLYEKAGFEVFDSWKTMHYQPVSEEAEEVSFERYQMSLANADKVLREDTSVAASFGPWAYIFHPRSETHIRETMLKLSVKSIHVLLPDSKVPGWIDPSITTKRYSMIHDLSSISSNSSFEGTIVSANEEAHFEHFVELTAKNFGHKEVGPLRKMVEKTRKGESTIFVVYLSGVHVAASLMEFDGPFAVFCFISVCESLRHKGIGTELVLHMLREAKTRKCSEVRLRAEGERARGLYENTGFRVIETFGVCNYDFDGDSGRWSSINL